MAHCQSCGAAAASLLRGVHVRYQTRFGGECIIIPKICMMTVLSRRWLILEPLHRYLEPKLHNERRRSDQTLIRAVGYSNSDMPHQLFCLN